MIRHTTGEFRVGMRVRLWTPTALAKTHPTLTIVEIDHTTGRVKLRHDPPAGGKGFAYLFWRDVADIEGGE